MSLILNMSVWIIQLLRCQFNGIVKQIFVVFSTEAQMKWFACNKLRGDNKKIMVSILGKLFINTVVKCLNPCQSEM